MRQEDLEFEEEFKNYLIKKIPFASELSPSELESLKDAYEDLHRAANVWSNTMTRAIHSIGSKVGIDYANDIDKAAKNQNVAAYNLGIVESKIKLVHGYVEEKGQQR